MKPAEHLRRLLLPSMPPLRWQSAPRLQIDGCALGDASKAILELIAVHTPIFCGSCLPESEGSVG